MISTSAVASFLLSGSDCLSQREILPVRPKFRPGTRRNPLAAKMPWRFGVGSPARRLEGRAYSPAVNFLVKCTAVGAALSVTSETTPFDSLREPSPEHRDDCARLERLLQDRVRKFMSILPKVLAEDVPDAVHDLRVWSRRLQQVVAALAPNPPSTEARKMVRALRRARRSLGGWRDCDVLIGLLERKARRVCKPEEKRACDMIRDLALRKRARNVRRARRRLANRKLFTLEHRAQKLLLELSHGEHRDGGNVLASSVAEGYTQWRQALSHARDGFDPADIHAFRIRTKRLRYRIEMTSDLDGTSEAEGALGFLRSLQDGLGRWHDQAELGRLTAEALANREFLLNHARLAAVLLRKADHERVVEEERVRRLLADAWDAVGFSALDEWVARNCRELSIQGPEELSADLGKAAAQNGTNGAAAEAAQVETPPAACPTELFIKVVSGLPR